MANARIKYQIQRINSYLFDSDEGSGPGIISETDNWRNCTGYLDNPNVSENDWDADDETDVERNNGIKDQHSPTHKDLRAATNVPELIRRM